MSQRCSGSCRPSSRTRRARSTACGTSPARHPWSIQDDTCQTVVVEGGDEVEEGSHLQQPAIPDQESRLVAYVSTMLPIFSASAAPLQCFYDHPWTPYFTPKGRGQMCTPTGCRKYLHSHSIHSLPFLFHNLQLGHDLERHKVDLPDKRPNFRERI